MLNPSMSILISWGLTLMGAMLAVPFFTLYERKMLSYIQNRKGPKKVSVQGILQPVTDGVKLICKGASQPMLSKMNMYWLGPISTFMLTLMIWSLMSFSNSSYSVSLGLMIFVALSSLKVYSLLAAGWSSNSKYCFLGTLRAAAQTISYEVSFVFVMFFPSAFYLSYNLSKYYLKGARFVSANILISVIWIMIMLAETKRAPFDFAEGESELVSGFNTEYSALGFTFLFLGEYGAILGNSLIFVVVLFPFIGIGVMLLVPSLMVLARGALPRFRYDLLMATTWKSLLPTSLCLLFMVFTL